MAPNTMSIRVRRVLELAADEARRFGHEEPNTCHLLLGLIGAGEGAGTAVLTHLGVDLNELYSRVERRAHATHPPQSSELFRASAQGPVLGHAWDVADELDQDHVDTAHVLLGLLHKRDSGAARALAEFDVGYDQVRSELTNPSFRLEGILEEAPATIATDSSLSSLAVSIELSEFADLDLVAERLARLTRALSAYHIAVGGSGLEVDGLEISVTEEAHVSS